MNDTPKKCAVCLQVIEPHDSYLRYRCRGCSSVVFKNAHADCFREEDAIDGAIVITPRLDYATGN